MGATDIINSFGQWFIGKAQCLTSDGVSKAHLYLAYVYPLWMPLFTAFSLVINTVIILKSHIIKEVLTQKEIAC